VAKVLAWLKKVPTWIWIAVIAGGLLVTTIVGWRRAASRLAAALESARSAERTLAIETEATDQHAEVAAELEADLAEIDDETEAKVAVLDAEADAVEVAEDRGDGSLADMANDHFGNEG
jgi:hypothetical protein